MHRNAVADKILWEAVSLRWKPHQFHLVCQMAWNRRKQRIIEKIRATRFGMRVKLVI